MPDSLASANGPLIGVLFKEHSRWLNLWFRKQSWTIHTPDDLVADVFMSLLSHPNVAQVREPRAMMVTIAKRLLFDARRRKKLEVAYEQALMSLPETVHISPEERCMFIEALTAIDEALSSLSSRARQAFLMSQLDGISNKEIAASLGVSMGAVSKYMTQGFTAVYLARKSLDVG